jgi:5'-nucleotidase
MTKKTILISNDDGIKALGINALIGAMSALGDVWVVAPDRERSAASNSISLHEPLRSQIVAPQHIALSGTPTDSVYIALHHFLKKKPDLVVSGINHGVNLGSDVLYSGTISAAMEGAVNGIPAIAFSADLPIFKPGFEGNLTSKHFESAALVATELAQAVLERPLTPGLLLNVNIPWLNEDRPRGVKLCQLGHHTNSWKNSVQECVDPRGKTYYWIGGTRAEVDEVPDSDHAALAEGWVSLTPVHADLTAHHAMKEVKRLQVQNLCWGEDRFT